MVDNLQNMKLDDYKKINKLEFNKPNEYQLNILRQLLNYKVDQHDDIKNTLLNSGLRKIIYNDSDYYWGNYNINTNNGVNQLGKEWENIRHNLYLNMINQYTKSNLK